MSLRRSPPPRRPIMGADSNSDLMATGNVPQPDLRQAASSDTENNQITMRKRKQPENDLTDKFEDFESKILAILTSMAQTQNDKLDLIHQDLSLVKNELTEVKSTTKQIVTEQNRISQELLKIEKFKTNVEQKIEDLTKEINTLKVDVANSTTNITASATTGTSTDFTSYEDMMAEFHERSNREKNVIISGINERNSDNRAERLTHDMNEVVKILELVNPGCNKPIKTIRMGKYDTNKSRPLKVCFASVDEARTILRNKTKITNETNNIKCYYDQTPCQKKIMENTRNELKRRKDAGEQDLTIRFIRGIPKVVQNQSKNLEKQDLM